MLCVDDLCKGIKTRKIYLPHTHISEREASVAVLNPKNLGNNLTRSLFLKYDLAHPAISNQGPEDVFGGWPLNKLRHFSLLYPSEKSQAVEAGGGTLPEHQEPFDPGPWGNCFNNSI